MTQAHPRSEHLTLLVLAGGAVCISFAPVFVRLLGDSGQLGPTAIGFWRLFFGAIILMSATKITNRSLRVSRPVLLRAALAGFIFFLDLYCWHRSVLFVGAGISTILGNTQVFGTAILAWFIFKERPKLAFVIAAIFGIVGVVLLVGVGSDVIFTSTYTQGVIFGVLTGVAYSCYIITIKSARQQDEHHDVLSLMMWVSLFGAIFMGIATIITEPDTMIPPNINSWLLLISLALVAQALGWWAISSALPRLAAARSGLILLLQPVLATVWGYLIFTEKLLLLQIVGAAITLAAIYVGSVRRSSIEPEA